MSFGLSPARSRRAFVSARPKPQSIRTRVRPFSTTSPLPELPLPSEVNRIALLQLVVEKAEDLLAGGGTFRGALGVLHDDLRRVRARVGHVDAELRLAFLRRRLPELELVGPALLGLARIDVAFRIDVAHEEKALRAVAVLDRESDAVEREAHAPPCAVEAVVHNQRAGAVVLEHGVARLLRRDRRGCDAAAARLRRGRRRDLGVAAPDLDHHAREHFRFQLDVGGLLLPFRAVLVAVHQLDHVAIAHEDLGRARHHALLEARAVLVAARIRIHSVDPLADGAAEPVLRDLGAVFQPVRLHEAELRRFHRELVARIDPELANDGPDLLGVGLHNKPTLRPFAFQLHVVELREHRGARGCGRRRRLGRFLVVRGERSLGTRIRHRVAVVHRGRRELRRNLERFLGALRSALVFVGLASPEEIAAREQRERDEGDGDSGESHGVTILRVYSMQPASRSDAASAAWCGAANGVRGRRMPSAIRPMRFNAHFTGMGLDSRKRFLCRPSRRSLMAMASAVFPPRAAAQSSRMRRGATLAVTEITPCAPISMYESAVTSSPLRTRKSLRTRFMRSLTRSMLEVASLMPTMFGTSESRTTVSFARSATVRPGTLYRITGMSVLSAIAL